MRSIATLVLSLALLVVWMLGCVTFPTKLRPVDYGVLATPQSEISAEDGSFTIKSGERFTPPFQVDMWNKPIKPAQIVSEWRTALQLGAKRVRVKTGRNVLYGVLLLNYHTESVRGPGSYNYRIEIPEKFIKEAYGGNVSVCYEMVEWEKPGAPNQKWFSWVLWLSDTKFPD
jgi:hypothetical protein